MDPRPDTVTIIAINPYDPITQALLSDAIKMLRRREIVRLENDTIVHAHRQHVIAALEIAAQRLNLVWGDYLRVN